MTLKLEQALVVGENGHLLTTDGQLNWVVVVTREALDALAHRYDVAVDQLVEHAATLLAIAGHQMAVGDVYPRNRLWVFEEDVLEWLATHPTRKVVAPRIGRLAERLPSLRPRPVISAPGLSLAARLSPRESARPPLPPR